jgi:hypothetical protein
MALPMPAKDKLDILKKGVAIPASPLALDANRKLSERHQVALCRYYVAAGAGAVAVAVHSTQFEIREPGIDLLVPVLKLAGAAIDEAAAGAGRPVVKIAGVCGRTPQAVGEAELAANLEYDAVLLSLGAMKQAIEDELIEHCNAVSTVMPVIGFYLQPAVGGRVLSHAFWRRFAEIENVVAIKIAPFNRYQTLDVVRAIAMAGRENDITLYTGNDDNIIMDLLTPYHVRVGERVTTLRIKGGLLGQWCVWTKRAVELLNKIHTLLAMGKDVPLEMVSRNAELTDANSVVFDAANGFAGCIPGINEVLRRQGLMEYSHCLDTKLCLSPGQAEELDRVCRDYPWLVDDDFVNVHRDEWLR